MQSIREKICSILSQRYIFFFLAALFLIYRLLIILTSDFHPAAGEALYNGMIARELITGPHLRLIEYPLNHYTEGRLIVSILLVPIFLLFGYSLFSLKLLATLFAFALFWAWYKLIHDYFDPKTALWMALLFIFSPIGFTEQTSVLQGSHSESLIFVGLTFLILYRIFFASGKINYRIYFALLGLISGFGLYFHFSFLACLIVYLPFLLRARKIFRSEYFLLFILFFIVGFLPFIYSYFSGVLGTTELLEFVQIRRLKFLFLTLKHLIFGVFPYFLDFKIGQFLGRNIGGNFYTAIFVIAFFWLIWQEKMNLVRFLRSGFFLKTEGRIKNILSQKTLILSYLIVFLFGFALYFPSPHKPQLDIIYQHHFPHFMLDFTIFSFHYLVYLYPFIFVIVALFLRQLPRQLGQKIAGILMVLLIGMGIFGNAHLFHWENFGKVLHYRGYSYILFGYKLARYNPGNKRLEQIIPDEHKEEAYFGYGCGVAERGIFPFGSESLQKEFAQIGEVYRPFFIQGLASGSYRGPNINSENIDETFRYVNKLIVAFATWLTEYGYNKVYLEDFCRGILIGTKLTYGNYGIERLLEVMSPRFKFYFQLSDINEILTKDYASILGLADDR